jgi:PAS domain S-box-containing protein
MESSLNIATDKQHANTASKAHYSSSRIEIELDKNGIIQDCNPACEDLVGYRKEELVSRPISLLINMLARYPLTLGDRIEPRLDFICHCGIPFQMEKKTGSAFFSQLNLVYLRHLEAVRVRLLATPLLETNGR